jgi:translation initiation factor IF-2
MKLLREAGVIVRTHMTRIDAEEYKKIETATEAERKNSIAEAMRRKLNIARLNGKIH